MVTLPLSRELKWSWPVERAINLPLLVLRMRLAVPLWVLTLGIKIF